MNAAIIVAAGSSRRMGFDKLTAPLAGTPVLTRSLLAFERCDVIDRIVVVTTEERSDWVREQAAAKGIFKLSGVVPGAEERHLSVKCGLDSVPPETGFVAVHDAARPLVTPSAIARCINVAKECGAASLAHRVADTLKRATHRDQVAESVSRENLWAMETPQVFDFALLRRAYDEVIASGQRVTDEVSAVQAIGESILLVENDAPNLKITFPSDIALAEAVLAAR